VQQLTRPLFRLDPGWLFIAAGLSVCAAVMILPVQSDLHGLRMQLEQLRNEETRAYARLKAHSDFMDQVDRADPALIRRLAATQLNMVPEGDTPVLLAASASVPVTHWIESAVKVDMRPPKAAPDTMLSKLVNGPYRLWIFGAGIMSVFFGVLLGTSTVNAPRASSPGQAADDDVMLAADIDDDGGLALAMNEIDAANELLTADQVSGDHEIPLDELEIGGRMDPAASGCADHEITAHEPQTDGAAVATVEAKASEIIPAREMTTEIVADVVQDVTNEAQEAQDTRANAMENSGDITEDDSDPHHARG
jgi:hypothetical protein